MDTGSSDLLNDLMDDQLDVEGIRVQGSSSEEVSAEEEKNDPIWAQNIDLPSAHVKHLILKWWSFIIIFMYHL